MKKTYINCETCGKRVRRKSPTQKYCKKCSYERRRAQQRKYAKEHKEEALETHRKWREKNRDYVNAYAAYYRSPTPTNFVPKRFTNVKKCDLDCDNCLYITCIR